MAKKTLYRIKNWKEYNASLVARGSVTLWISDDARKGWLERGPRRRGHPVVFSDSAILTALTLRAVYRLPLRQTEGFLLSIFDLLGSNLPVPDYSTLSLRARNLRVDLPRQASEPLHLILDSTGLKIRGEGEWREKQGKSGHRKWRKFHVGLDALTQEIVVQELTLSRTSDATPGTRLIQKAPEPLASVRADGAYDKVKIYLACNRRGAHTIVPPRKDAQIRKGWKKDLLDGKWKRDIPYLVDRNDAIRCIRRMGRKRWKRESGYHRRSLVETAVGRLKRTFGPGLASRRMARQRTEMSIRCRALNVMTHLGMPESERVG